MPSQKIGLFLLGAALTLAGAGCFTTNSASTTQPTNTENTSTDTQTQTASEADLNAETTTLTQASPCPEETERFWSADQNGTGFTFCFDTLSNSGEPVMWEKSGRSRVTLYSKENQEFAHSVTRLEIGNLDPKTAIETNFMTAANRQTCEVISGQSQNGLWTEYVIAGGDLETQLTCGEYRDGFFIAKPDAPDVLFYVMIGQDTFMRTQTWLESLKDVR